MTPLPPSPFDDGGNLRPDVTAAQVIDYMTAAPDRQFASNPWSAVSWATVAAAEALHRGDAAKARLLTHVACGMVEAADNPDVFRGEVLTGLVGVFGEPAARLS